MPKPENKEIALKHYLKIAGKYFRHFEGRHLYPSWGNYRLWLWFIASGVWIYSTWYFATSGYAARGKGAFPFIAVPEVIWLGITFWIRSWKDEQILETTNRTLMANFKSMGECRLQMLQSVTGKGPSEFLEVAKEIDDLVSLKRKFRKSSDLTWAEFARSIYDSDSKARLLALAIVLVSTTVALSVRSDATLDAVFDLFTEPAGQAFLLLLAVIAMAIFFGLIGLRVFAFTLVEVITSWSVRFLGEAVSPDWLLSYLVRDLVAYHGSYMIPSDENVIQHNTEAELVGVYATADLAINSSRESIATPVTLSETAPDPVMQN